MPAYARNTRTPFRPQSLQLPVLVVLLLCLTTARAADDEVEALKREVNRLRERVEMLENRLQEVLEQTQSPADGTVSRTEPKAETGTREDDVGKPPDTVSPPSPPETDIAVGGQVKFDAIYNSRSVGGPGGSNRGDQAFLPGAIPVDGVGEDDQISFSARDSRLWVKAHTPTRIGDLAGYVEMDFASGFGNERVSNSYNPRLRHAYATYGGFTIGQTYTTFLNISAFPEVNDANGPPGILNVRQPLLRYRRPFDWGDAIVSLEQPETTLTSAAGRIAPDDDRVPDVVGKLQFNGDYGNWSMAALLRRIRYDDNATGVSDGVWGGAVSASGRLYLNQRDNLRFSLAYGNALGRYFSYNSFDDGVLDAGGNISLTEILGGFIAYQHWWSETWRSSFIAGYGRADHDQVVLPEAMTESFYSTQLNLLWSPTLNATLGIEWLHGYREREDGRSGDLDRIQFTSTYKF